MQTGIIRRATREDLPRLSRLVARERIDRRELARMMARGTVLVLDSGERLGGAAYTCIEDTDLEGRVVFRILGVDPALADQDIERRLAICMLATCQAARQRDLAPVAAEARALRDYLRVLRDETRRRVAYLMIFLLALPRVVASSGTSALAIALCLWSGLALLACPRLERIPRAVARETARRG